MIPRDAKEHYEEWILRISPEIRCAVRPDMLEAIFRYAFYGVPVGDFLQAVIKNNLREACGRADYKNLHALPEIVKVFYNYCPAGCWGSWGSKDAYEEYLELRRVQGPYRGLVF